MFQSTQNVEFEEEKKVMSSEATGIISRRVENLIDSSRLENYQYFVS